MEKHIYFLFDGHEVVNTKMMTIQEAIDTQRRTEESHPFGMDAPVWYGPFTVSGPHSKFPWLVIPAE